MPMSPFAAQAARSTRGQGAPTGPHAPNDAAGPVHASPAGQRASAAERRDPAVADATAGGGPPRLPAAPLVAAVEAHRQERQASRNRLLGRSCARAYLKVRTEGTVTAHTAARLCGRIGTDPREVYGDAYDRALPQPSPRRARRDRVARRRLPAAPLVAAIDERCRRRDIPHIDLLVDEAPYRAYLRARQRGTVALRVVEDLCDALGWHPRELYQDAWDAVAFAGRPAGYDPWAGVA